MRNISPAFAQWLKGDSLTLAVCVLLTRQDGTTMGFTSCDRDLTVAGHIYEASNAITGSAVKQAIGTAVDNMEVVGLLRSDRITTADCLAGRYDSSSLELFLVNFTDLSMGKLILLKGKLGDVRINDGQFTAEIRSLSQLLGQNIGELTSPTCRVVRLGDARCKVNVAALTFTVTITSVIDADTFGVSGAHTTEGGYYAYGVMRFESGANAGLEREIKQHFVIIGPAGQLTLQEPFPYPVSVGDQVRCEVGCDRLPGTCSSKFSNIVNFRGEPSLPGQDSIQQVGRATS